MSLIGLLISMALLVVQYTNCSNQPGTPSRDLSSVCFDGEDCYDAQSADKLDLRFSTPSGYEVIASFSDNNRNGAMDVGDLCSFDMGGTCNDGGYSDNQIQWSLVHSQGVCEMTSYQFNSTYGVQSYGKCENGYFSLRVYFPCLAWQGPHAIRAKIVGIENGKQVQSTVEYHSQQTVVLLYDTNRQFKENNCVFPNAPSL